VMSRKGFHARISRVTVCHHFSEKRDIPRTLADRIASRVIGAPDPWPPLPFSTRERSFEGRTREREAVGRSCHFGRLSPLGASCMKVPAMRVRPEGQPCSRLGPSPPLSRGVDARRLREGSPYGSSEAGPA